MNDAASAVEDDALSTSPGDDMEGGMSFDDLDESFDMLAAMPDTPGSPTQPALRPDSGKRSEEPLDTPNANLFSPSPSADVPISQEPTNSAGRQDSSTPARRSATRQALRRSPRLSAMKMARTDGTDGGSAGRGGDSMASGISKALGEGGSRLFGAGSGVTPYSTRRGRRASQKFQPVTPGSAFRDAGQDEANASFR